MQAAVFSEHGDPSVLITKEVSQPKPADGQVLVRVRYCGLNHVDHRVRQGTPAYPVELPHILGADVAGEIAELGNGCVDLRVGQRVILSPYLLAGGIRGCHNSGGYAQFTVAQSDEVFVLPDNLSFEIAAAFPLVFLTAWHLLNRAGIRANETVLIHAAGSGVGHAAILIAKYLGAEVIATAGTDAKCARARELGADETINYRTQDVEDGVREWTGGKGVNVVADHIGPDLWQANLSALAPYGRLVTCGGTSGPAVNLDLRTVFSRQLSIIGSMMGTADEFRRVFELFCEERLLPCVDSVYPLQQAAEAHRKLLSRDFFGKILLKIT